MTRFLIVDPEGCGTGFASRYLRQKNLRIGHEVLGQEGFATGELTVRKTLDVSHHNGLPEFDRILHLVRSPLKVISSFQTANVRSRRFICDNSP